jgi:hypothetical protein
MTTTSSCASACPAWRSRVRPTGEAEAGAGPRRREGGAGKGEEDEEEEGLKLAAGRRPGSGDSLGNRPAPPCSCRAAAWPG